MKAYTFEVMKRIVVTVEADSREEAVTDIESDLLDREYEGSFHRAAPVLTLLDEGDMV